MKLIRALEGPTKGLADYLDSEGAGATWVGLRNHQAGESYRELAEGLEDLQHGLCGYCEIDILERDRQVEHVIPQSDPESGAAHALDSRNMIACCKGGTLQTDDANRRLDPVKRNRSCGEAKGNRANGDFVDPRTLPELPSLTRVNYDGRIVADVESCQSFGMPVAKVEATIELLGLNVERLRRARESRWNALSDSWAPNVEDPLHMEMAARAELIPSEDNRLAPYFTTSRSYFGDYAERVLSEFPRDWI